MKVIYTAYFVDDPAKLLNSIPVALSGGDVKVFAHHVTKAFRPPEGLVGTVLGRKQTLNVIGEVVTDRIQAVLANNDTNDLDVSNNTPHITIATASGASPKESNDAIEDALSNGSVKYFKRPVKVDVTEGYFDGHSDIVSF